VSKVIWYIKGTGAKAIARTFVGLARTSQVKAFGREATLANTVGRDEDAVHNYIVKQAKADKRLDQL
jgi:hypothetical protein